MSPSTALALLERRGVFLGVECGGQGSMRVVGMPTLESVRVAWSRPEFLAWLAASEGIGGPA